MGIIQDMNHFTVLSHDLEATLKFYGALGLKEGPRPPFGFPGAWLYVDQKPILHVVAGRELPPDPAGVLDHMAFTASNLKATVEQLKLQGVDYSLVRQPQTRTWQLFCHDPSGAKVELDFSRDEAAPAGYE
jgi:catechol 2,3-dioxygenase-like lactoylglutathione lyase family enzyme